MRRPRRPRRDRLAKVEPANLEDPLPEEPELAAVHRLSERLGKCPRDGAGRTELDITFTDAGGSTMMSAYHSGSAATERCMRDALHKFRLPATWTATYALKRDGVLVPFGE